MHSESCSHNPIPRRHYALLAVFLLITYGYFFQGGGWNQNGRVCLIRAILHHGTFSIDPYREDAENPHFVFVNTGDWSYCNGRYYSNKSPGLSFLALAPYAAAEYLCGLFIPGEEARSVKFSTYAATLCTVSASGVLLCLTLLHLLTFFFGFSAPTALIATLGCGLGTLLFSYSTTFYSHVPAAAFSLLGFAAAMHIRHGTARSPGRATLGAGIAASWAVLIEPSTVLMLCAIGIYLLTCPAGRRWLPVYIAGCVPAGLLQCWYNAACFGGPFNSSYDYANDMVMARVNGRLFGFPRLENFIGLLVLPYRGLLVSSPLYLMALPGTVLFFRNRRWRAEALFFSAVSCLFIVYIACFYAWYGGSTVGPRYLVPAYPFMFMLTVYAAGRFPKMFIVIGAVSVAVNLAITLVGNEIPASIKNPLADVILQRMLQGKVSINPVPIADFHEWKDIQRLTDITRWTDNFNSFNLGEMLFPHHIASVLPLLGWWMLWGIVWWSRCRRSSAHT